MPSPRRLDVLLTLLAGAAGVLCFAALDAPWVWVGLLVLAWLVYTIRRSTAAAWQVAGICAATLVGTLTAVEWLLRRAEASHPATEKSYFPSYLIQDSILGTRDRGNVRIRAIETVGTTTIYSVGYTLDRNGMRIVPPARATPRACVLFMGDSFTFGEGVPDDQAIPYRVGALTAGAARVYNFGAQAYGAAQMLALLERGSVAATVQCRPTHIIYIAIADHVLRAAGLGLWAHYGPRYHRTAGGVAFAGLYGTPRDRVHGPVAQRVLDQLRKSAIQRWLAARVPVPSDDAVALFGAIVRQARESAAAQFPGARFDVLLWPYGEPAALHERARAALARAVPRLHLVEQIIPGFRENPARFWRTATDHHPTAAAMEVVARFIVSDVLEYRP